MSNMKNSRRVSNSQLFSMDNRVGKHRRRFPGVTLDHVRALAWPLPPTPRDLDDVFPSHRAELVAKQVINDCLDTAFRGMQMRFLDQFAVVFAAKEVSLATKESLRYLCPGKMQKICDPIAEWGIDRGDNKVFDMGIVPRPPPLDCMASRSIPTKVKSSEFEDSLYHLKDSSQMDTFSQPPSIALSRRYQQPHLDRQSSIGSGRSALEGGIRRRQREAAIEKALAQSLYGDGPPGSKKKEGLGSISNSSLPPSRAASRKGSAFPMANLTGGTVNNNAGWTYSESSAPPSPEFREQRIINESKDVLWKKYNECNADNDDRVTMKELLDFLSAHGCKMKNVEIKPVLDEMGVDNRKGVTFSQFCLLVRALLRVNPHFTLEVVPLDSESVDTAGALEHERLIDEVMQDHHNSLQLLQNSIGQEISDEASHKLTKPATPTRELSQQRRDSSMMQRRMDAADRTKRLEDLKSQRIPGYNSHLTPQYEVKEGKIEPDAEMEQSKKSRPRSSGARRRPGTAKSGGSNRSSTSGKGAAADKEAQEKQDRPLLTSQSTSKIFRASAFAASAGGRFSPPSAERKTVVAPNAKHRDNPADFRSASTSPLDLIATLKKQQGFSRRTTSAFSGGSGSPTSQSSRRRKRTQKPKPPGLVQQVAARALSAPALGIDGIPRNNLFYKRPTGYKPDILSGTGHRTSLSISPGVTLKEKKKGKPEQLVAGPPFPESDECMRKETFQNLTSTLRFMEEAAKEDETEEQMMKRLQEGGTGNATPTMSEDFEAELKVNIHNEDDHDWFLKTMPGRPIVINDQTAGARVSSAPHLHRQGSSLANKSMRRNQSARRTSRSYDTQNDTSRHGQVDYSAIVAEAAQMEVSAKVRQLLKEEGMGEVMSMTVKDRPLGPAPKFVAHNGRKGSAPDSRRIRLPPKSHRREAPESREITQRLGSLSRGHLMDASSVSRDGFVNKIHSARQRSAQLDLTSKSAFNKSKEGGQVVKFQQMLIS